MKIQKYIFLLSFIACSLSINAQEIKGYAIVALNGQQIDGDRRGGYNQLGVYGGLGVYRKFSKNFQFNIEIAYANKGSRDVPTKADPAVDSILHANYVDFPILLTYIYKPDKFFIQLGPYFGRLISANSSDGNVTINNFASWYLWDFGVSAGMEYKLKNWFSVYYRYSHSVITTSKTFDPNSYDPFYHNISALGIKLYLNKK